MESIGLHYIKSIIPPSSENKLLTWLKSIENQLYIAFGTRKVIQYGYYYHTK